jgi:hypothetical protein
MRPASEEAKQASWLTSQQPDVFLVSKPESPQSAVEIVGAAKNGRKVYVSFIAGNTFDTLPRGEKCVAMKSWRCRKLKMVISGRTCESCASHASRATRRIPKRCGS